TWVDFTILFVSYYMKEQTTEAIGKITFYNMSGQMLGILIGGWVADLYGFEAAFLLGGVIGALGLVGAFFIIENKEENDQKITMRGVIEVASDKTLVIVSSLAILFQLLAFATVFGFTPVYAQNLGASKFDMGLLTFFSTFPMAIAAWIGGGYLSRYFGEKTVVIAGFVFIGLFTIVIPFVGSIFLLIITQCLAGLGRGFVSPILMSMSIKHMDSGKRATAMGFYQAIYGLGMFIGPLFMGVIGDWLTLEQGFIILGLLGCFTAILTYFMLKHVVETQVIFSEERNITG
ncbi:MFS transporter, partial [Bacillus sp. JJ1521]|uniref:MFS transporter n=1 Tax=Bacillus sp. JJ1521 TaxID=3122957 RepID=UPI003000F33F